MLALGKGRYLVITEIAAAVSEAGPLRCFAVQRLHLSGSVPYGSAFRGIAVLGPGITGLGGPEDPAYVLVGTLPNASPLPACDAIIYHTLPPAFTECPMPGVRGVVHHDSGWTEVSNNGVVWGQLGLLDSRRSMHIVTARFIRSVERWSNQTGTQRTQKNHLLSCFHHILPRA